MTETPAADPPAAPPQPAPRPVANGADAVRRRVLVVDDHSIFREALAGLIDGQPDLSVCGLAGDLRDGVDRAAALRPDLALVDISLEGRDGIELIKELKAHCPDVRVLVLSMHDESVYAERALRAGAMGYVMKSHPAGRVLAAVRRVLGGEIDVSDAVAAKLVRGVAGVAAGQASPVDRLSDRELQVFRRIGKGMRLSAIAAELHLSVKTVESHREHIKRKLGLATSGDLLRYAIEHMRLQG
jgi:DNA-binding NarL/FixJ family response regulator